MIKREKSAIHTKTRSAGLFRIQKPVMTLCILKLKKKKAQFIRLCLRPLTNILCLAASRIGFENKLGKSIY
ncbi:hypothetical protein BML2496_27410 [Providencia rettgeri]|nr:hypothetical protein BML2496_27410 [Providencia rettgeri]